MGQSEFEFQFNYPPYPPYPSFRLFTKESITKIRKKAEELKSCMKSQMALSPNVANNNNTNNNNNNVGEQIDNSKCLPKFILSFVSKSFTQSSNSNSTNSLDGEFGPNPSLEAGKHLPTRMGDFPPELYGKPIEDLDEFYNDKPTFMVVARDKTIFRFSATDGLFFFSPFNPVRRIAIYILTHPCFSLLVMTVILVNCIYMAANQEIPDSEAAFTSIYTIESSIKILARGLIMGDFTYLKDVWNWLDFIVVSLAYVTIAFPVGNLAVLRTFRVLRALKTVAVVPGLKTIVGALMEAVRRLRDVMILTVFVLSIFALVGLQIYQGTLKNKCVHDLPSNKMVNHTFWIAYTEDKSNWFFSSAGVPKICGNGSESGKCPANYTCLSVGPNPNYGYTNFDNYGYAMLCAFRLMTQDCWENLYQMVLTANGPYHIIFFIIVIFLGSFYLVNLILAIVAMSYDDCQKMDRDEEEAEAILHDEEIRRKNEQECIPSLASRRNSPSVVRQVKKQSIVYTRVYQGKPNEVTKNIQNSISSATDQSVPPSKPVISIQSYNDNLKAFIGVDFPFVDDSRVTTPADAEREQNLSCESCLKQSTNDNSVHVSEDSLLRPFQRHYVRSSSLQVTSPENMLKISNGSFHSIDRLVSSKKKACFKQLEKVYPANASISPRSFRGVPRHSLATPYLIQRFYGTRMKESERASSPPTNGSSKNGKYEEPTHFRWVTILDSYGRRKSTFPVSSSTSQRSGLNQSSEDLDIKTKDVRRISSVVNSRTNALKFKDVEVLKSLLVNVASPKKVSSSLSPSLTKPKSRLEGFWERLKLTMLSLECSPCWRKVASYLELFILDPFVDLFITICIVLNTVFMAMDHAGMKEEFYRTLVIGNYVFTTIFTAEAFLKILAIGLYRYVKDKWNCFDIIIVLLSLIELGLSTVKGLSILRSFRLLRVFKLAKSWPTLNLLIGIIGRTMGALGNLCFVLAIIIFIFAVMGMQLFGEKYTLEEFQEIPRWNFRDFLHSFMIVFRVLCGEWVESMWNCIHCSGVICIPFFLLTMIIGNLVVLNLFLALLLSSFGAESLQTSQGEQAAETNKLQEAIDRITRFVVFRRSKIVFCCKAKVLKRDKELSSDSSKEPGILERSGGGGKAWSLVKPHFKPIVVNNTNLNGVQNASDKRRSSYLQSAARQHTVNRTNAMMNGNLIPDQHRLQSDGDGDKLSSEDTSKAFQQPSITLTQSINSELGSSSSSSFEESNFYSPHSSKASSITSMKLSFSCDDDEDELSTNIEARDIFHDGPEVNEVNVVFIKYPDECCPKCILDGHLFCCWRAGKEGDLNCCQNLETSAVGRCLWKLRCMVYSLVEHRYFETFIIIIILSSSVTLAVEDKNIEERRSIKNTLKLMDKIFSIIFVVEMVLKQLAYGFHKYFTDAWCWLDFIIVLISIVSLGAEGAGMGNMGAFRALRTLRALRPLRAVSRWEGMKVVVNALIQAIPAICNVLLVCLVFWLIFSIMGVNLFGGRYGVCVDSLGATVNSTIVANETQCMEMKYLNYSWTNPNVNFDHVPVAYLALFQVATFKGWADIMNRAVDSREIGQQPERESRVYMYLYFVFFIVFGSFFTLNLFIGVIIDNFNMQKRKAGGSIQLFMTEDQKKYYNAMKKLGSKQPQKPIPKPKLKCSMFLFRLTSNQKFDVAIMTIILLNMVTMTMEHYNQPEQFTMALGIVNSIFICIFTVECLMKLIALRIHYFKQPWNIFDFCVVVLSILGLAMKEIIEQYFVSPTLLRVVRVFRVGRILRLVKSAKGIRTLLFSLAVSLPALFNIGLLLFLIMFIYAIFGMSFFMHVRYNAGIEELFNFETFGRSMTLLFQISTSAGWDMVLAGLTIEPPYCNASFSEDRPTGDCGNKMMGVMYLVTYLVISFLVVVNMYIAVILENFSQATEDVQQGLTQDDFDMYYEIWEKFDEKATQYIPLSQLSTFADALEKPLRIPKPNLVRLTYLDIPICEGERVHCVDILDALAKNYLAWNCYQSDLQVDLKNGPERKDYHPISSTMKRRRHEYCAIAIQRFWRKYKDIVRRSSEDSDTSQSKID